MRHGRFGHPRNSCGWWASRPWQVLAFSPDSEMGREQDMQRISKGSIAMRNGKPSPGPWHRWSHERRTEGFWFNLRLGRDLLTCIQQKNAATVKACLEQQVPRDWKGESWIGCIRVTTKTDQNHLKSLETKASWNWCDRDSNQTLILESCYFWLLETLFQADPGVMDLASGSSALHFATKMGDLQAALDPSWRSSTCWNEAILCGGHEWSSLCLCRGLEDCWGPIKAFFCIHCSNYGCDVVHTF